MTDDQAKIVSALRLSNTALTQAEIAGITGQTAEGVRRDCYALGAAGQVAYRGGYYSLMDRRAKA